MIVFFSSHVSPAKSLHHFTAIYDNNRWIHWVGCLGVPFCADSGNLFSPSDCTRMCFCQCLFHHWSIVWSIVPTNYTLYSCCSCIKVTVILRKVITLMSHYSDRSFKGKIYR
jgi:hypothetical protein